MTLGLWPPAVWIQTTTQLAQAMLLTHTVCQIEKKLYHYPDPEHTHVADAFLTEQYMWKNWK